MELFIPGPSGRLEAELWLPDPPASARAAAVVCHPHPQAGGTMHTSAVFRIARGLRSAGLIVLRFNFRGVGRSEGISTASELEEEDVVAAVSHLRAERPELALWGAGYSFGARTMAAVAARDLRVGRVILVAPPFLAFDVSAIERIRQPGLIVFAEEDAFGSRTGFVERFPHLPPTLEIRQIPATDHFFRGKTPELEDLVWSHADRWLGAVS